MSSAWPPTVSRETQERLDRFAALLSEWSARINLISRNDRTQIWPRHILDSLQLLPLLADAPPPWIDLGSGAGFPGLILAIASRHPVHLVESDQRKAAFLREAIRVTGAAAVVHAARIEAITLPKVAALTARALAPLPELLDLAAPLLQPNGICVFPKGRTVDAELTAAARQWHMRVERTPSHTDPTATILKLSELRFVGSGCRATPSVGVS